MLSALLLAGLTSCLPPDGGTCMEPTTCSEAEMLDLRTFGVTDEIWVRQVPGHRRTNPNQQEPTERRAQELKFHSGGRGMLIRYGPGHWCTEASNATELFSCAADEHPLELGATTAPGGSETAVIGPGTACNKLALTLESGQVTATTIELEYFINTARGTTQTSSYRLWRDGDTIRLRTNNHHTQEAEAVFVRQDVDVCHE